MQMLTSRPIMKYILLAVYCVTITGAVFKFPSKNFVDGIDKVASLAVIYAPDVNFDTIEKTSILAREAISADSNNVLNIAIDNLRTNIIRFSDTIELGSNSTSNSTRSNSSTTAGPAFKPPSSSKLTLIENEIKKMKNDIQQIKDSTAISEESKTKLILLEEAVARLQKLFDDQNRETENHIHDLESQIDQLTGTVNDFRKELDEIKRRIAESEKLAQQKALPAEIIEEIKSRNFDKAVQKIKSLDDPNKINYIVHDVYNNNAGNFDLVLQFGNSIQIIPTCFRVYKALNYEMESNNHADPFKLVALIYTLDKKVIEQPAVPGDLKQEAITLNNKIKYLLKSVFVQKLKEALKNNNYGAVSELCDRVFLAQFLLFNEAIVQVTHEIFNDINASDFVRHFGSHRYYGQTVYGYAAVFNELRSRGRFNDNAIVTIAFNLKRLMVQPNFPHQVHIHMLTVAENVRDALPTSLRNLAFSYIVCIKNIAYNEYLYAAGNSYKADNDRRRVLTWTAGVQVNQGDWMIEPAGDVFYIKSFFHKEYFYAANYDNKYDKQRRNVYTWIPGGRVNQGIWTFELEGDNVYIKNAKHGEYLFADYNRKLDRGRRHVFTWMPGGKTTRDSLWKVESCG